MTDSVSPQMLEEYGEFQAGKNCRRHRHYGPLVFGVFATYLVFSFLIERPQLDVDSFGLRYWVYNLTFVYMCLLGLLPLAYRQLWKGPNAERHWPGNTYIALLLLGAAVLGAMDSEIQDVSAVILISLPPALVHSAERRRILACYGLLWLVVMGGALLLNWPMKLPVMVYMLIVSIALFVTVFVALNVEHSRFNEFMARWNLNLANRELQGRSRQLKNANVALELRSSELELANRNLQVGNRRLEEMNTQLEAAAMTDQLTGLPNRRRLYEVLDAETLRSRRYGGSLSLAVIDLDDFKAFNETYGHLKADEVLAGFAQGLRERVRGVDLAARFGGEEFVVVMPDSNADSAQQMLERIRSLISQLPIAGTGISVTFSAGIAEFQQSDADYGAMLKRADELLGQAKASGKNRVLIA